jgi:hypothetical protein
MSFWCHNDIIILKLQKVRQNFSTSKFKVPNLVCNISTGIWYTIIQHLLNCFTVHAHCPIRVYPHPGGCTKCILWCSRMVLRRDLDLYQWSSAKRQLTYFASDSNDFFLPQCTKCAHILEDVQSASCDAVTWFSGLI